MADGSRTDKYRLGLSTEDQRLYASLQASEGKSFDEELAALANTNSLIRMSRRWESQKDSPPSLGINLGHASLPEDAAAQASKLAADSPGSPTSVL